MIQSYPAVCIPLMANLVVCMPRKARSIARNISLTVSGRLLWGAVRQSTRVGRINLLPFQSHPTDVMSGLASDSLP